MGFTNNGLKKGNAISLPLFIIIPLFRTISHRYWGVSRELWPWIPILSPGKLLGKNPVQQTFCFLERLRNDMPLISNHLKKRRAKAVPFLIPGK